MKRISDRFLQLAVLGALTGMSLGVMMGKSEDFTLAPLHAHINLLLWVSMTLYGLFYRVVPKAAQGPLPVVHFWVNVLGVLTMLPSLAALLLGRAGRPIMGLSEAQAGPIVGIASVIVLLSMLLFAIIVFRATWSAEEKTA